jgi:dipeptide transport system permease protein
MAAHERQAVSWRAISTHGGLLACLLFIALLVLCAILAPLLSPHDPAEQYRDALLAPPVWDGGSSRFPLGTDSTGRDMLSRLLHGARASLLIGLASVVLSLVPGVLLGLVAAFHSGRIGTLILRTMDVILALPALLLAVALVAVLGPGLLHAALAIAVVSMPGYVRLVRASALAQMSEDYVVAARMSGAGSLRIMFDAVLPNCLAPIVVAATLGFSEAILTTAALGFLGLGAQPPTPEWGSMLSSARDHLESARWVVTLPGLAILSTVLAINIVGDGLRDALDPRLQRRA